MGLLDSYFDPQQFAASGGLLGRLLSLQQMQGQYLPSASLDPQVSADNGQAAAAPISIPLRMPRSPSPGDGPAIDPQMPDYGQTQNIPIGDYQMPQFGRADVSQAMQQPPDLGDRLRATGEADSLGNAQAGFGNVASSIASGQPPGLSKAAYFEIPTNANLAFLELSDIREKNERDTVSREDHVSGVRDGNITRNPDGSLDVTNGTVVTFSYKDGRAKTVTVTNNDIAHIDGKTGEVVIQKSPLGDGI